MKRMLVALLLVCTTVAYAGPHQVIVLRAEGSADASSRTTIETHVLRIAKSIDGKVEAGDITLSDAAAAAGCDVAQASCKDEILAVFGVDELVAPTVTLTSTGSLAVTVRRLQKDKPPRVAASTVPRGSPPDAKLDQDIGPLFGTGVAPRPVTDKSATTPPASREPPPAQHVQAQPSPVGPVEEPLPDSNNAPTTSTEPEATTTTPQPSVVFDAPPPNRKWQKVGMGVGAGLVLLSFVMWGQASSKQDEIDSAPTNSPADFARLRDLESEADNLAGGGNFLFLAGVVCGGVSAYYYWKKGRAARTQSARVTPAVFPNGAGIVLTFGGGQ